MASEEPDIPSRISRKKRFGELLLIAVIVTVMVFVLREVILSRAAPELSVARDRVELLDSKLESLTDQLERTEARLVVMEREVGVIRLANRILRDGESQRQAEITRLQGELDFYRRLAGTVGTQNGLAIYQLDLERTESDRVFHFVLTLTQNIRRTSIITGKASMDIEGTVGDRPVTLEWSQITLEGTSEPAFRFKYFDQIEGYLALPEGFSPTRLLVSLQAKEQREPVRRSFDWRQLTVLNQPAAGYDTGPGD